MNNKNRAGFLAGVSDENTHYYDITDSTSSRLKELARKGAPEGSVVIADSQTDGRGRLGRSFESPAGRGVYMSVLLRPDCGASEAVSLTALSACAVCRAIENCCGVIPDIKWVNDLLIDGRKICGILCESELGADGKMRFAVIGIGLNVSGGIADFSPPLREKAGSLFSQSGVSVSRRELCAHIRSELMSLYEQWKKDHRCCLDEYRRRCVTVGNTVSVRTAHGEKCGTVAAIADDYSLVFEEQEK